MKQLSGRSVRVVGACIFPWTLVACVGPPDHPRSFDPDGPRVHCTPPAGQVDAMSEIELAAAGAGQVVVSIGAQGTWTPLVASSIPVSDLFDHRASERILAIPTAMQWEHPLDGLPVAGMLRTRACNDQGRCGPEQIHTYLTIDHGALPVVSLVLSEGALFDPDSGIHVVGNAMLDPPRKQLGIYQEDGRPWKYPGNFHYRGKAWERSAMIQFIDPAGGERFQAAVGLRVHGNMTRGFPQKALRIQFKEPLPVDLFGGEDPGARSLILRAAGNDQRKAFLRDALAHRLCMGLPMESSRSQPMVVYINGAYWGLHHLRERLDEKEVARRHGVKSKQVQLVEGELTNVLGAPDAVQGFRRLWDLARQSDTGASTFLQEVEALMDVDQFLTYIGASAILGVNDWPRRNVKAWRFAGTPVPGTELDGRWRFLLPDADLALGANATAEGDLFNEFGHRGYPVPDLFNMLMQVPGMRERFISRANELLDDRFDVERTTRELEQLRSLMAGEMPRHIARWRRPVDVDAWEREIGVVHRFLVERPDAVRRQLRAWPNSGS